MFIRSYKEKLYILLFISLVFFIICYNLGFKKTLLEVNSIKENQRQLVTLHDAPVQLQILEKKLKCYEGRFDYSFNQNITLDVLLLEKANTLTKSTNLKITELPKNNIYSKDGFSVKTQAIIIQGPFNELLTFLYLIAEEKAVGIICSVDFNNQKNMRTDINLLIMKIYFQTIFQETKK